jgi:hypothetical protein
VEIVPLTVDEATRESLRVKIDEMSRRRMEGLHYCPQCQRWLDLDSFYVRGSYPSGHCRACSQAKLRRRAKLDVGLIFDVPDITFVEDVTERSPRPQRGIDFDAVAEFFRKDAA